MNEHSLPIEESCPLFVGEFWSHFFFQCQTPLKRVNSLSQNEPYNSFLPKARGLWPLGCLAPCRRGAAPSTGDGEAGGWAQGLELAAKVGPRSSVGRVESFPQPRQSLAEILTDAHRGGWNGKNIDVPITSFGIPCEISGVVNCTQ